MKLINWFKESNRYKHLLGGFIVALCAIIIPSLFIFYSTLIGAFCLEYKDKVHGGKFDLIDFGLTIVGGIIINIIYLLLR